MVPRAPAEAMARLSVGAADVPAEVRAMVQGMRRMLMTRRKLAAAGSILLGLPVVAIGMITGGPGPGAWAGAPTDPTAPIQAGARAKPGPSKATPAPARIAADTRAPAAPPATTRARVPGEDSHREAVMISGRATDDSGRPVAGATVYILDINRRLHPGDRDIVATLTTGPDGRYVARDVELRVWAPDRSRSNDLEDGVKRLNFHAPPPQLEAESRFQVAGTAPGFGFTWSRPACYLPEKRRPPEPATEKLKQIYRELYRDDPFEFDLVFRPPASIHGKVVDDRARPLGGATVQFGAIDDICAPGPGRGRGREWFCLRMDPRPDESMLFDGIALIPESITSTRTGPDGTYRLDGLPRECQAMFQIDPGHGYEPYRRLARITAGAALPGYADPPLRYDAVLDCTLDALREARFTVRYADTNQPAPGLRIRTWGERPPRHHETYGVTDEQGRTTVLLPPGEHGYDVEVPLDAPYRSARGSVTVDKEGVAGFGVIALEPVSPPPGKR
jgi:hypothetical protein